MQPFTKTSTVLSLAGALGLMMSTGCGGCGDDGGDVDARVNPDAPQGPDADTTDAADPDADIADLRSGTIAVTQVSLANELTDLGSPPVTGAGVGVTYTDETSRTVAPSVGTGAVGECTVFVYDVGSTTPPDEADEGMVEISGAGINPETFPTCTFVAALGDYKCFALPPGALADGANWDHEAGGGGSVASELQVPGADFSGTAGMLVNVDGFAADQNNGSFMILAVDPSGGGADTSIVRVFNFGVTLAVAMGGGAVAPNDFDETYDGTGDAGTVGTLSVVAGESPIVGGFDFIDDFDEDITIEKAAGGLIDAFTVTIQPSGDTVALTDDSADITDLVAEQDHTFSCDGGDPDAGISNGDCGNSGGLVVGWTLSGSTTDGSLETGCDGGPCLPIQMPEPDTQWADFVCRGQPGSPSITLTEAAMTAILGTNPTRMQTRLLRVTADLASVPTTSIVAGKGWVGFTDF